MTPRPRVAPCLLLLLAALFAVPALAAEDAILLIEQTSGGAGVQRDGKRLTLASGDALQEQDLIVTDATGRMTLRLGRHGFLEVGPDAEVGVERLPFAAYARDLKSIFSIGKGYLRVVWKYPQTSTNWPLFVYMSGHRISLVGGEYFFQSRDGSQRACVAAGQIALQAASSEGLETLKPPACAVLTPDQAPQISPRNPDDWIAIRRALDIEATAAALLAREAAAAAPAAAPAAKPGIVTTPLAAAVNSTPLPVADAPSLGPVAAAPVLPAPLAAPRTTLAAPLPDEPPMPPLLHVTTPVRIGEVQAAPVAAAPSAPAPKPAPAPVIATPPALAPAAAAPAPAAAPATPAAAAKPAAGKSWTLNIASYSEAAAAEQEAARLREAGYRAAVTPATVNGKTWHRVQVGGYTSNEAATAAAVEINGRFNIPNIWVLKP